MSVKTADLCDQHRGHLQIAEPLLRHFGGRRAFGGQITTVKIRDDNALVRATLEEGGGGRVLVVDGGGSLRCALVGDVLGGLARSNGWAGIVVFGCVRDSAELAAIDVGVLALTTCPMRGTQGHEGRRDVPVSFAGVSFTPGHYLYADEDGLVLSESPLI